MKIKLLFTIFDFVLCCTSLSAQTIYEVVSKKAGCAGQPNADAQVIGQKKEHDLVEVYSIIDGWACIKHEKGTGFVDQYCIKPIDESNKEEKPSTPVAEDMLEDHEEESVMQYESEYAPTHYTKSMINGEGAFYYRGFFY